MKKGALLWGLLFTLSYWGWGQTPYLMSGGDYSELFTNIANATNWPNGFNGTDCQEWTSVAINASGTLGDGIKITVSTAAFSTSSSGGVQRGSANIYLLSTSTANSCAIDLLLNFSGRNAGTISFDVATVFNSTGDRDSKLKLFYSTDGTTFTEITGTNLPYTARNNVASSASITNIALPSAFNNSTTARLRFYEYSTTGGATPTGSQPKISIDNIAVTSTASGTPTITISSPSQVSSGSINQGAIDQSLSHFQAAITTANATLNSLAFTTAGTYAAADMVNFKLYYGTTDVFGSATSISTISSSLGTGSHTFSSLTQAINSGVTGYFWITCDVYSNATAGNTINVAADPVLTFASGTPTGTISAGGSQTIQELVPGIAISSPNPAVAAGNITQNTTNNVIYRFDNAVTVANATMSGLQITTTGTYAAADLTNLKAWYSADASFSAGSDVLLSTKSISLGPGTQVFPSWTNQLITNGTTGYIFITTDIPCSATSGNTISVNAVTTSDVTFVSGTKSGSTSAGGTQTIIYATPTNVTSPAASVANAQSEVSWTNPAGCYNEVMIVAKATSSITGTPSGDGSAYTANLIFGSGTAFDGGSVVYKGTASPKTVTGLANGTLYYFKIFTRNGTNWSAGSEVSATPSSIITIAAWDPFGVTGYGSSPWSPTSSNANLTIVGLTRGSGVGTSGTAAGNAWGGTMNTANVSTSPSAITNNQFVTFSLSSNSNYSTSLTTFDLWYRRSASGPAEGLLQYSIDAGTYNDIGILSFSSSTSTGAALSPVDLSGILPLQGLAPNVVVIFRIVLYNNTTVNGTWYVYNTGLVIRGEVFSATTFSGTGNWSSGGNWSNGLPASSTNTFIDGVVSIDVAAETKNLTINVGKSVTINNTKSLTVTGTLTNSAGNAGLVIESGGSLLYTGSVSATVKRSIANSSGWHFLSSPVAAQNICDGNFAPTSDHFDAAYGATYDFFYWSEPVVAGDLNWINLKKSDWGLNTAEYGGTPQFTVNKGYLVNYGASFSGSATKSFTGALNTGDQSVTLTTGGNTWNLIGNPFPSAINWDLVTGKANLADGYYQIYNPLKSGGAGYESYLDADHKTTGTNGKISAMQGFFVKASSSPLGIPNSSRVHDNNWLKNMETGPVNQLKLKMGNALNFDEAFIIFEANGSMDKGWYDAPELSGISGGIPQVYTLKNTDEKICINSLPFINDPLTLPVGMYIPSDGNYSLELTGMESFPSLPGILLEDLKTQTTQNMIQNPVYNFSAATSDHDSRFLLHFAGPIGINEKPAKQTYMIFSSGNSLFIQDNTGKNQGNVFVYNMMGQLIASSELNGNSTLKMNLEVPAGYYIVKVRGTETIQTSKVFIP